MFHIATPKDTVVFEFTRKQNKFFDAVLKLLRENPCGLNIKEIVDMTGYDRVGLPHYMKALVDLGIRRPKGNRKDEDILSGFEGPFPLTCTGIRRQTHWNTADVRCFKTSPL